MSALWLVALAFGADPAPLLDRAEYRFCNEPGVDRAQALLWCDSLEGLPDDVCPGLRATCAGAEGPESGCNQGSGGEAGSATGAPEASQRPPKLPDFPGCPELGTGALEAALKWGGALAVAVLVAVLLRLLVRWMGREAAPASDTSVIPATEGVEPDPEEVPDRPSGDLLVAARTALGAGRGAEAVLLARGAALRRLAERGRISLHRSRTDREHVRALRGDAALYEDLRDVANSAEVVRWGGLPVDLAVARRAVEAAGRLVAVAAALALLGPVALASDRYGPRGDAALGALFERAGYAVTWRTKPLVELDETTDLLVLDLGWVFPGEDEHRAIRSWVEAGGVLVVAGDASGIFPELEDWVPSGPPELAGWTLGLDLEAPRWPDEPVRAWSAGSPLVGTDGSAAVAEIPLGAGVVVGIADGALLENGALIRPENRRFLAELPQLGQAVGGWPLASPIAVELATRAYAQGQGSGGGCAAADSLANGRLLAVIFQVLVLWSVVAALRGAPFAVPRDPPPEERLMFADHAEALARRAWRTGDRGWADAAYARLWLRRIGVAGLQSAAARAGRTPAEARQTADQIERLADGKLSDPDLVEELWRITR